MKIKYTLKYLFEAELFDGTIYKQNLKDHSIKFPPIQDEDGEWQGKSCISDIQEDIDNFNIKRFSLVGDENKITVDLVTGLFEVNGVSILAEGERVPALPENFKLIYTRKVRQQKDITVDLKTMKEISSTIKEPFVEYFIGWECLVGNRKYQQKIAVI